jgi:hypothetical protein
MLAQLAAYFNAKGTGLENAVQKCEWMAVKQYQFTT